MTAFVMPVQAPPRNALYWMLVTALLTGATIAIPARDGVALAGGALAGVSNFLLFLWYCRDGNVRRFHRTIWWNIGMVTFSYLVLPVYLWRTRARGRRLRTLGAAAMCGLLLLFATSAGAMLASMLVHYRP